MTVISYEDALVIFKSITGNVISKKTLADLLVNYNHLRCWKYDESYNLKHVGINKERFEYFVSTRMLLNGHPNVFSQDQNSN